MPEPSDPFQQFEGIEEPRDVQPSHTNKTLDKLLELESRLINRNHVNKIRQWKNRDELYEILAKEELKDIPYTEQDLEGFIFTKCNSDYDHFSTHTLGLFTGCLLQFLTEKNRKLGKKTVFYINGQGNRFDYLFSGASIFDTLMVENFLGNGICSFIRSSTNSFSRLIGINLKGNNLFEFTGFKGCISQVIGINFEGDFAFGYLSTNGVVEQFVALNITGKDLVRKGTNNGRVNQAVYSNLHDYEQDFLHPNADMNTRSIPDGINSGNVICEATIKLRYMYSQKEKAIFQLAKSMDGKPYQEVLRIADELYALRPTVP